MLVVLSTIFAFEWIDPLFGIGPLVFTNVEGVALSAIVLWFSSHLVALRPVRFPGPLLLPGLLWLTVLSLSTILAPAFRDMALLFTGRFISGMLIGLVTFNLANTRTRRITLIIALTSGVTIVAMLGLMELLELRPVVTWLEGFKIAPTRVGGELRVSSTLGYANITAMVLEMGVPLLVVLGLLARRVILWVLAASGIVIILATHILTLSRAGFFALLVAFMLMVLAGWRRGQMKVVVAASASALLLVVIMGLVLLANPTARLRLATQDEVNWYRVRYDAPESLLAQAGWQLEVPVRLTNTGERAWTVTGGDFFSLSYHLLDASGELVNYDGARTFLPADVMPGETVAVRALVLAPADPGIYTVEWDMVQETVTWFSGRETPTFASELIVTAGGPIENLPELRPPIDQRLNYISPGRTQLWPAAWRLAVDHPLFGVGPDNFRWSYGPYAGLTNWNTDIHANNLYLEWLTGTGLIGFLAFIWFSWRLAHLGLAQLRCYQIEGDWLISLGLVAGLATWYVHGFFDYFYEFTPTYIAFWLLVGFLAATPAAMPGVMPAMAPLHSRDGHENRI